MEEKIVERPPELENATLNQGWIYRDTVPSRCSGWTVLDYYSRNYGHSSIETWHRNIELGRVQLDGQPISPDISLQPGQTLAYHRPPWYEPNVPLQFEILYEDESLWAIAKPSGLPVLPGGNFLSHTLLHQLRQRYPTESPVPMHRLGRGTSGVMLIARTPQARSHLSQQFRTRTLTKIYRALVQDGPMATVFTTTVPIGKVPHPTLGYVYGATPTGKYAHSEVTVLQRHLNRCGHNAMVVSVKILTGRPHQIRIHLAAHGYPLLGDPLYGVGGVPLMPSPDPEARSTPMAVPGDCGYWLHAEHIQCLHPTTHAPLAITCPAPPPLQTG